MAKVANIEELEHKKISKLIWQYALPSMIGTTVNAFYNIIDRIFIGHGPGLGDDAMSAIGAALPIMIVITAIGMLTAGGAASRISIYMGKRDKETAERIVGCAVLLCIIITVVTIILMMSLMDPLLHLIGVTAGSPYYVYAKEFLQYYLPGSIFLTLCWCFNNMLRASGYPTKSMITMLIGVCTNVILAPLFIFGFRWGIKGAALATVGAMFVSMCFAASHFLNPNSLLRLRLCYVRLHKRIIANILSIGLPAFLMQMASATVILVVEKHLKLYGGDIQYGVYTIANTLLTVMVMITQGMTQGTQPIIGYNYGAENYGRIREVLKYTIKVGILIGCIALVIGEVFPHIFARIFHPSLLLENESAKAMHIVAIFLPLVGFQIVATNFFLSIGKSKKSIFLSLTRQFIFLIPAMFILSHFFQLKGVWMAMPTADLLSTVVTLTLFVVQIRQFKKKEEEQKLEISLNAK